MQTYMPKHIEVFAAISNMRELEGSEDINQHGKFFILS